MAAYTTARPADGDSRSSQRHPTTYIPFDKAGVFHIRIYCPPPIAHTMAYKPITRSRPSVPRAATSKCHGSVSFAPPLAPFRPRSRASVARFRYVLIVSRSRPSVAVFGSMLPLPPSCPAWWATFGAPAVAGEGGGMVSLRAEGFDDEVCSCGAVGFWRGLDVGAPVWLDCEDVGEGFGVLLVLPDVQIERRWTAA